MSALLVALVPVLLAIGGAGGYIVRRVIERGRERDAVAIERARIDYLKELKTLAESLSQDTTTRTLPLIAAAIETSLVNLAEEQSRSSGTNAGTSETHRPQRLAAPRYLQFTREDFDKTIDRVTEPLRTELAKTAKDLVEMSFIAARDAYELRDLIGFKAAWGTLARGAGTWAMACHHGRQDEWRATTQPMVDSIRKWFRQMDAELGEAFARKRALILKNEGPALVPLSDATPLTMPPPSTELLMPPEGPPLALPDKRDSSGRAATKPDSDREDP